MINDYSLAVIVGRLSEDPKLGYTASGLPYAKLAVEVRRKVPTSEGTSAERVSTVEVLVQMRLAEICCQFLRAGRTVLVVGAIRQRVAAVNDGFRPALEVIADRVQFLDRKAEAPATENKS